MGNPGTSGLEDDVLYATTMTAALKMLLGQGTSWQGQVGFGAAFARLAVSSTQTAFPPHPRGILRRTT